jgi:hypothetical protein
VDHQGLHSACSWNGWKSEIRISKFETIMQIQKIKILTCERPGAKRAPARWDIRLPIHAEWGLDRIALAPDGLTLVGLSCAGETVVWSLEDPGSAPFRHSASPEDAVKAPQGCAVAFAPKGQGFHGFATGVGPLLRLWSR